VSAVFWLLCLVVAIAVPSVVSGVHPIVVGLLASCVGVDRRSWMFAQSALCFISCPVLAGLYQGSLQTLFFLNAKRSRHDLEKNSLNKSISWKLDQF
jgi:hypothetical protein